VAYLKERHCEDVHTRKDISEHRGIQATKETDKVSIERLVEQAIRGDQDALVALCHAITRDVLFSTMRLLHSQADAEDATQEILIRVCQNIRGLKTPEAFKAWLNSIIINESRRQAAKNAKRAPVVSIDDYLDTSFAEEDEEFLPEEHLILEEDRRAVIEIIDTLPDRQREAVVLHYYKCLNVMETAQAMNVSQPTVSRYLKLAREKIKAEIQKQSKKTGTFNSVALLPVGGLLAQVMNLEAAFIPQTSEAWINLAVGKSTKNTAGTVVAAIKAKASMGLLVATAAVVVGATIIVTGVLAGREPSDPSNGGIQQGTTIVAPEASGEIVFTGSEARAEHINPRQATVWASNSNGALSVIYWWVNALSSEDILYSGEGTIVEEPFTSLRSQGVEGDFILSYKMQDSDGNIYTLARQFTIRGGVSG